jgi:hypothetical protein
VHVAGISIPEDDVLQLVGLLHDAGFDDTAEELVVALEAEQMLVALSILDREQILRVLDDPPTDALAQLRGVPLREHEWRAKEELI